MRSCTQNWNLICLPSLLTTRAQSATRTLRTGSTPTTNNRATGTDKRRQCRVASSPSSTASSSVGPSRGSVDFRVATRSACHLAPSRAPARNPAPECAIPVLTYKSHITQHVNTNHRSFVNWPRRSLTNGTWRTVGRAVRCTKWSTRARAPSSRAAANGASLASRRGARVISAPGGNRTRGLRLERPLLFGSPKRTVDH